MEQRIDAAVEAWLTYQRTPAKADLRAAFVVDELTFPDADPEVAWELICALIDRAPDELLGAVGAGPLENAVTYFAGQLLGQLLGRIEERARRDPRFREALAGVWLREGALRSDVQARVIAASNGAIRPLPARKQNGHRRR
jgi:hypothetical protein